MRVNIYAEEMTDRLEIIGKEIDGHTFTGLRFFLELPATVNGQQYQGPFMHRPGDDDSSAVTFWGKRDLRAMLRKALAMLDEHYAHYAASPTPAPDASKAPNGSATKRAGKLRVGRRCCGRRHVLLLITSTLA